MLNASPSVEAALTPANVISQRSYQNLGHSASHLTLYNAHNGQMIKLPKPIRFHTINSLKNFILESFSNYQLDSIENIFLLTSFGIKFNFNVVNDINDIYVYDKRLFSSGTDKRFILEGYLAHNEQANNIPIIGNPPALQQTTSITKMSSNFRLNEEWAKNILKYCQKMDDQIKKLEKQINVTFKCISNVFLFASNFVNGIEKSFNNYYNHIKLISMKSLHRSWDKYYKNLQHKMPLISLANIENAKVNISLNSMLSISKLESASENVRENLPNIIESFNSMQQIIKLVNDDRAKVDAEIENLRNKSIEQFKADSSQSKNNEYSNLVLQYCQTLSNDLEKITNSNGSVIEEIYQEHINSLLPQIFNTAEKLHHLLQTYIDFYTDLSQKTLDIYSEIANLQLRMVNLKEDLKKFTSPGSHEFEIINQIKADEDYLSLTIDLPLLFGFILIEKRRQYEWKDFYSKGIVKNLQEQMTIIIENEKNFQQLWNKKFGNFLNFLNFKSEIRLPSLDITLISSNIENSGFISNLKITREDITQYIKILTNYAELSRETVPSAKNFPGLLEKNFSDLIKSTGNLKRVTKISAALSIIASDEHNLQKMDKEVLAVSQKLNMKATALSKSPSKKSSEKDEDNTNVCDDLDLDVIQGLKLRIKKLESLLHQQQFKNLSQWPVTRTPSGNISNNSKAFGDSKLSLISDQKMSFDPTKYLSKATSSIVKSPNSNTKVLDASTTIDKHLDNIRLRKENQELITKNSKLSLELSKNEEIISDLRHEILLLKQDHERNLKLQQEDFNKQVEIVKDESSKFTENASTEIAIMKEKHEIEIKELKLDLENRLNDYKAKYDIKKEETISNLQKELSKYITLSNERYEDFRKSNEALEEARNELSDLLAMKNDLLENLSSKETEFTKERIVLEEDLRQWKIKFQEKVDDYEDLMEVTQTRQNDYEQLIENLVQITTHLFKRIKSLSDISYQFYYDFCLVLESMGLLLVKENDSLKIVRVKGLRNKKVASSVDESEVPNIDKPTSKVLEQLEKLTEWLTLLELTEQNNKEIEDNSSMLNRTESKDGISQQLIDLFKDNFEGENNKMDLLINGLYFPSETTGNTAFVSAISRRFKDVEGFAKKLTKETRSKTNEINKLQHRISNKISINDFQIHDLVLFLPTRIDNNEEDNELQPWAAFNFGSPHYFLRVDKHSLKNKDWMVGKIISINSYKVTDLKTSDKTYNPFQLKPGTEWFYIDAKEIEQ